MRYVSIVAAFGLIAFVFAGGSSKPTTNPIETIETEDGGCSETRYNGKGQFDLVPCYSQKETCRTDSECEAAFGLIDELLNANK